MFKIILIYNPELSTAMDKTLKNLDVICIPSLVLKNLPKGIAGHPDLQIHPLDYKTVICAPECFKYYREQLPKRIDVIPGDTSLTGTYPGDCAYNAARVGDFIFCNTKCTDKKLLQWYNERNFKIIHVNQGYTKCNIFPVTDKILITEDVGIHNIITDNCLPIECYMFPNQGVFLNGFPYGFIGGSCGVYKNIVFWYGNPNSCKGYSKIKKIISGTQKIEVVLSEEKLCDLGGIICLT